MKNNKKIYFGGTFEIINYGHILAFQMCKGFGDYLIVGLNTNELVKSYKKIEPVLPYEQKKFILESIKYIDEVIPVNEFSPMSILVEYKPDIYCVGSEFTDIHEKEISFVKSYGGEVKIIPAFDGVIHTSEIKRRLLAQIREE